MLSFDNNNLTIHILNSIFAMIGINLYEPCATHCR